MAATYRIAAAVQTLVVGYAFVFMPQRSDRTLQYFSVGSESAHVSLPKSALSRGEFGPHLIRGF